MLRTKITELGKLTFLDDGGLVCSVTSDAPPPLDASPRAASLYWASPEPSELAIGDLVVHSVHGVARYRGRKSISQANGEEADFLVLEYADAANLYVPLTRTDLVQKLGGADCTPTKLSTLNAKGGKWPQSYCVEVSPKAYEWPGIGTFPELPQELFLGRTTGTTPQARAERRRAEEERRRAKEMAQRRWAEEMAEWRRACATYQKALHADASYRKAAQEYFERQSREPQPLFGWWVYRAIVLQVGSIESAKAHNHDEQLLLIKQYVLRRERKVEKIRREVEALENWGSPDGAARKPIPESVRLFVWRRDKGQCVQCGSRERLEFDHIIPVVAGGSNTERNIQLLCESCNRSKSATV
ncbi:MAG: CarD family transcriptional regulator [Terriglobales bacterium]